MSQPITDLATLLRTLDPVWNDGVYVFAVVASGELARSIPSIATFGEAEGTTVITSEAEARKAGLSVLFRAAWITLNVHSGLDAVGLTAAVSQALADAGISCNVVAAAHHDHVFVPVERAGEAMVRLKDLGNSR
jgi:hypothetical protein